jgi:ribose/xylose/arabinose/galactoside ABC-type transport system permease subunit
MSSTVSPRAEEPASPLNRNSLLMLAVAILSFLFAEQILAGWLPLGERLNMSRRDLNPLEIAAVVSGVLWGLIALYSAWGFLRQATMPSIRSYFSDGVAMPPGVLLTVAFLIIVGVLSLLLAEQVLAGWLPLGERVNISRRDLNVIEWLAIIVGFIWGILCLRTTLAFLQRDRRAWTWGQWLLLLNALAAVIIFLSGIFDVHKTLPARGTFIQNLAGVLELLAPPLLAGLSALVAYRYLSGEIQIVTRKEISGSLSERALSRDMSAAVVPADQSIRNTLARFPGAGAVVGFLAIFIAFSVATDLFLEPRSPASWLSNNITNGIVAIGMTLLIISGEIDLSVGSMMGVSGLAFLGLITGQLPMFFILIVMVLIALTGWGVVRNGRRLRGTSPLVIVGVLLVVAWVIVTIWMIVQAMSGLLPEYFPPVSPVIAAILSLLFTGFLGFINGYLRIRTALPSFIVTLGMLSALRAVPLVLVEQGKILRYADYFGNTPPNIYVSRWLVAGFAVLLALVVLFLARAVLPNLWQRLTSRWANRQSDDSDFAALYLLGIFLNFLITLIAIVAVLYLLLGSAIDQVSLVNTVVNDVPNATLDVSFFDLMNGRIVSLPLIGLLPREVNLRIGVFWWFLLVVIFQFVLTQTRYGNSTFAVGGNPGAALAQGINVNRIKVTNFILIALLVGIAAIFDVSRVQGVDALRGAGLELEVIAASVIGGALLAGGYGSVVGSLLGVFIFGSLQTGLVIVGMNPRLFNGVIGAITIGAAYLNELSRRVKS